MKQTKILFSFGILLLAAISCTSDESISSDKICNGVSFDVSVAQLQEQQGESFKAPAITNTPMKGKGTQMYLRQTTVGTIDQHMEADFKTRGTKVEAIDRFKLYSYKYDGNWSSSFSTVTQVSNGVILESGNNWKLTTPWFNTKMAFFGIYDETNTATFSNTNGGELTYTVPETVAKQKDLLVAKTLDITEATNDSKVPMTFSHALTAVQFGIGSVMAPGTITKVELQGIKNAGTYNFISDTWTTSGSATYTIDNLYVEISSNKGSSSATRLFTGSNNDLLLLMPQTLGTNAKLIVYITEKGKPQTLSVPLTGEWKAGHTVTYSLTTNSETGQYVFLVGSTPNIDENGGTSSTTIKSYYQDYYGTQTAIGWTASYSLDGEAEETSTNSIVTDFTASGTTATSSLSMTFSDGTSRYISTTSNNTHTATLRSKQIVGSASSPKNLAGTDGSETTANCYIVGAPGYFKFPVVYGNGLKNGSKNSTSITGAGPYVNHLGNPVTAAYLNDNANVTPAEALVVWQDAYHLVSPSSVKLSSDKKYISFYVPKDYICQGNCVIAVRDASGIIMWSWHIWVTDLSTTTPVTNTTNNISYFPAALGHCDPDNRTTLSHKATVTIKQNTTNATATFTVSQTPTTATTQSMGWNCTYYQWGRKDPQRPSDGNSFIPSNGSQTDSSPKHIYDNDTYPYLSFDSGHSTEHATVAQSIMNPSMRYFSTTSTDAWYEPTATVPLWTDNFKTIYDPSPAGYRVPNHEDLKKITVNGNGGTWDNGYTYDGSFWPAYGNLWSSVSGYKYNSFVSILNYYSSTQYDTTNAYYTAISSSSNKTNKSAIKNAASIRPFKE